MADKTNYLEEALLNHVLRGETYTPPATIYLALFSDAPGETGGGTEVSGGSYSRQPVTFNAAAQVEGAGVSTNDGDIVFNDMPQVTVVASALMDADTGGNVLYYEVLTNAIEVAEGASVQTNDGAMKVEED